MKTSQLKLDNNEQPVMKKANKKAKSTKEKEEKKATPEKNTPKKSPSKETPTLTKSKATTDDSKTKVKKAKKSLNKEEQVNGEELAPELEETRKFYEDVDKEKLDEEEPNPRMKFVLTTVRSPKSQAPVLETTVQIPIKLSPSKTLKKNIKKQEAKVKKQKFSLPKESSTRKSTRKTSKKE